MPEAELIKSSLEGSKNFDLEIYNKVDCRELGANHIETVKAKLAEVLA